MQFNSLHFALFLPVVFVVFRACVRYRRFRTTLLLAASYYFYMSWDWRYAGLIAFSTLLDYLVGLGLSGTKVPVRRKMLLVFSLVGNLGVLGLFKYYNFFAESFVRMCGTFGFNVEAGRLNVLLPVGISFYTFQTLSYTIEVYRGKLEPTRNLLNFAFFVAFFPQLVAGPIVRASHFLPQIEKTIHFDENRILSGLFKVFRGLVKKIVIADTLALAIVDPVFKEPGSFGGLMNLLAVYAYAMQIYCDFSGYSDIAVGAGRMLGFKLPINFNRPYLATCARDFWSRWHISLSTWLRDYLYIPLGGNRRGRFNTYRNLLITMLLGGLWHGAAWNFVLWGAFHGVWLLIGRIFFEGRRTEQAGFGRLLWRRVLTFHLVCFGWILFRGGSPAVILTMLKQIGTFASGPLTAEWLAWVPLILGFGIHFFDSGWLRWFQEKFVTMPAFVQGACYMVLLILFTAMSGAQVPFIYFQF